MIRSLWLAVLTYYMLVKMEGALDHFLYSKLMGHAHLGSHSEFRAAIWLVEQLIYGVRVLMTGLPQAIASS